MSFCSRILLVAGLAAGLVVLGCSSPSRSVKAASAVKPDKERKKAPDFSLKDPDGRTVRLSDYRGKVVLLDFWATWCGPCKIEIPWFMEFERRLKDRGFAVIGVSMDDEGWSVVKPFISDLAINYRVLMGNDMTAQTFGGVEALPTTFLIDREGRIAAVHVGLTGKKEFADGIEELLQAPPPAGIGSGRVSLPALFVRAR